MTRKPVDRHYTPPALFDALVPELHIRPGESVLLCSGGHGAALAALERAGAVVYAVDIDPDASIFRRLPQDRTLRADFLLFQEQRPDHWPRLFDWVVDNVPFSLADEFLAAAIRVAQRVAFILRSTWIGSRMRTDELVRLGNPRNLLPCPRPSYDAATGDTDMAPTLFVVWDNVRRDAPTLEFVRWKAVRGNKRPLLPAVQAAFEAPWWTDPMGERPSQGTQLRLLAASGEG